MICDRCNENQATIHVEKYVNGEKQEVNFCEKCIKDSGTIGVIGDGIFGGFNFQDMLNGFINYMNNSGIDSGINHDDIKCDKCKTTLSEFTDKGLLGCDKCYDNLKDNILNIVKKVQKGTEHKGKVPSKLKGSIDRKKQIEMLKDEMQEAIEAENFERAAEIRDILKKLS